MTTAMEQYLTISTGKLRPSRYSPQDGAMKYHAINRIKKCSPKPPAPHAFSYVFREQFSYYRVDQTISFWKRGKYCDTCNRVMSRQLVINISVLVSLSLVNDSRYSLLK